MNSEAKECLELRGLRASEAFLGWMVIRVLWVSQACQDRWEIVEPLDIKVMWAKRWTYRECLDTRVKQGQQGSKACPVRQACPEYPDSPEVPASRG